MEFLVYLLILGLNVLQAPTGPQPVSQQAPAKPPENVGRWSGLWKSAQPADNSERLVLPKGSPPKNVSVITLQSGSGKVLRPKDWFQVNYRSFDYRTGKLSEDHWGGAGFSWTYGIGQTVRAWEPGLRRMREGEWRELIVPSDWAYRNGARVYLVELRKVK